jgi:hypothetical protein
MSRRAITLTCAIVALLCLCLAAVSVAGYYLYRRTVPTALPETPVELTGHMLIGFEVASFVPCGDASAPGASQGYWLSADPGVDLYDAYHAAVDDYTPAYLHFVGRLSPPGQYGHLSAYTHAVTVTQIIELNATGACP